MFDQSLNLLFKTCKWSSKIFQKLQRPFITFSTKFAIDHQICVSKLVNGLRKFSRNFSDRSSLFAQNLRSITDHQVGVSKLVNCRSKFSRNFSDRSSFFNTKFVIDHQICVSKLVNGLRKFSRNFSDRS